MASQMMLRLVLLIWACNAACALKQHKVAVIGAGIGGSAAAYFMREQLPNAQLDIFEERDVGGRTQIWNDGSEVYEMGASIIHEQNKYFRDLADKVGLERVQLADDGSQVSIWDGREFVFNESSWSLVTLYRMYRRYGLSYFYMRGAPAAMLQRYKRLYKLQADGQAFDTPQELLRAVNLYDLTQRTLRDVLLEKIGSGPAALRFAGEFIAGINRIQYNQGNGINAFAGMVSLLPTIDGRLFNIRGGNRQLAERLIKATGAHLHLGTRVTAVHKRRDGSFELQTRHASEIQGSQSGLYDAVLVAVPLELTNITISGVEHKALPLRKYQRTVTTLVSGQLRPSYFGVEQLPKGEYVMVAENSTAPFSVIGPQRALAGGLKVFKLFSREPLSNATLGDIFQNLTVLTERNWLAYPEFDPPERFQPFRLAEGLYLNNAWENAASAMEMSAVAAKNCALLIAQHLRRPAACDGPGVTWEEREGPDGSALLGEL